VGNAIDIHGTVFTHGTATLMARVVGNNAQPITQADVASVEYSVFLLDDKDADSRTAVTGHTNVTFNVPDVIFNSLQTDDLWKVDETGYNFRHTIDVSENQAFTIAGRRFLVEFTLTPVTGQVILARFRMNVI